MLNEFVIYPLFLGAILVLLLMYVVRQSRSLIDIFCLLVGMLFLAFVGKPFYLLITDGAVASSVAGVVGVEAYRAVFFWVVVGVLSLFFGILAHDVMRQSLSRKNLPVVSNWNIQERQKLPMVRRGAFLAIAMFGAVLTLYLTWMGYRAHGWFAYRPQEIGVWGGLEAMAKVTAPAFLVYVYASRRIDRVALYLLVVTLLAGLSATGRSFLVTFILGSIYIYHMRVRALSGTFVMLASFAGVVLVWLLHMSRTFLKFGISRFEYGPTYAGPIENLFRGSALFPFDFLNAYAYLTNVGFESVRLLDMYVFMLLFWVPRQLWPDKPVTLGTALAGDHDLISARSWSVSMFGDSLISGGIPFLIINMIILGYIVQYVRIRAIKVVARRRESRMKMLIVLLSACLFANCISLFKNGIANYFISTLVFFIMVWFVYAIAIRWSYGNAGARHEG